MKLSTKTRYGTRAMLDLALNYERGVVGVREIAARRQVISEKNVKSHVSNILGKSHSNNRTQAAVSVGRKGVVRSSSVG